MDRITNTWVPSVATVRNTKVIPIVPFAAPSTITVSGNISATTPDISSYGEALLFLDVTAISGGSASITFYIDTYNSVSNKWFQLPVTISAITTVSTVLVPFTNFGETIRLRYTVSGTTPSITFNATVVAKS